MKTFYRVLLLSALTLRHASRRQQSGSDFQPAGGTRRQFQFPLVFAGEVGEESEHRESHPYCHSVVEVRVNALRPG